MTFVTTYKQADLTLTGTMRKAQLAATATKTSRRQTHHASSPPPNLLDPWIRRASSISTASQMWQPLEMKKCMNCNVGFSPVWWPIHGSVQSRWLCHKCHWMTANGENHSNTLEEKGLSNGIEPDSRLGVDV